MPGGGEGHNAQESRHIGSNAPTDYTNKVHKTAVKKHRVMSDYQKWAKAKKSIIFGTAVTKRLKEKYLELSEQHDRLLDVAKRAVARFGTAFNDKDGAPEGYSLWVSAKDMDDLSGFDLSAQPTVDGGILLVLHKIKSQGGQSK